MTKSKEPAIDDKLSWALNKIISKNLQLLLDAEGLKYTQVVSKLKEKYGHGITASYFNKLLHHPDQYKIPIIFLLQCAEFFNVSIDALLSDDFDPNQKKDSNSVSALNLDTLLSEYENAHSNNSTEKDISYETSAFIEDTNSILFKSILQNYHCYFYPTASRENKAIDSILHGTLEFKKDGKRCKAIFTIQTNKKDKRNQSINKIYEGYALISTTVNNLYCILKSEDIGEYCFIIFRHFHLNYEFQDCHLAELLSTSSAKKERYPTVLRIFLSKEPIKTEHIQLIAPHLWLNYSQICITQENLSKLMEFSEQYKNIAERLLKKADSENMLFFKEKDAIAIANDYLDEDSVLKFITDLRSNSYAYHYNKVSDAANDNLHDFLMTLGYYQ